MQKDKLKELIKQCLSSVLDEESASGDAGGYLGIKAFKPKYENSNKAFNRNPARTKTAQDANSPAGFESMPDSGKVYIKSGFKVVKPSERIDAKDLWKNQHLEENITVMKFKIVDPKEELLNEGNYTSVDYKPYIVRDANNPNFLKIFIKYPEGVGHLATYGQKDVSDQEQKFRVKKAMEIGQALASKLESSYNLEDIDVFDNGDGKVIVFAISDDFIDMPKPPINEVRYSKFKSEAKTRTPQEQLHMGVKEMQRKLDEINRLVDFTTRMKNELKGDAEEMNLLKRTHNSLFKINEKIQEINDKIKSLTT
jgi:hypothetical protein